MKVTRLNHAAITVSDIDRSLAFYRDVLGLREVARHRLEDEPISTMVGKPGVILEVVRLVSPETPEIQIDLQQYIAPPGGIADSRLGDVRNSHLAFEVADLGEAYERWSAAGVRFVSAPVAFDLGEEGAIRVVFRIPVVLNISGNSCIEASIWKAARLGKPLPLPLTWPCGTCAARR